MKVGREELPAVTRMVKDLCGVALDDKKAYLIDSRLGPLVQETRSAGFQEFCRKVRGNRTLELKVIDAITTQETLFMRDDSPFEALRHKAVPETVDAKAGSPDANRLRIWSAACSTGQEPYSIAMTLYEILPDVRSWDINILATDISDAAIRQASLGRYAAHEIRRGLTPPMLAKYFDETSGGWRVKEHIRSMVRFDRRNLLEPFTGLGPFDIIFCRNVAIYFEPEAKRDLFVRLADRLTRDGYLFVGSSESLGGLDPRFVPQHHCRAVFYQPNQRVFQGR